MMQNRSRLIALLGYSDTGYGMSDTFEFKDRFDARFLRLSKFNIAEILLSKQETWLRSIVTHWHWSRHTHSNICAYTLCYCVSFWPDPPLSLSPSPNAQACLEAGSMGRNLVVPPPQSYLTITLWMWDETDSRRNISTFRHLVVL